MMPRHSGGGRNPKFWTPAFAGVTVALLVFSGCSSTYKRDTIAQNIKDVAKKEYKLDVEVLEAGDTVTVRFPVKNLSGEMMAPDQLVWNQVDNIMVVLSRVALSIDRPPLFLVLDMVDEPNPNFHILFTRCVTDLRKLMGEAQSRTDYQDRLLMELQINGIRKPLQMDPVWLMMMASEAANDLDQPARPEKVKAEEVSLPSFLAKVSANMLRRILQEKQDKEDHFLLRDVAGLYLPATKLGGQAGSFHIQLDLVSKPTNPMPADWISSKLLPMVAQNVQGLLRSYNFDGFSQIAVVERNSGKNLTVPKG